MEPELSEYITLECAPEYAASENVTWHQDCFERKATENQHAQEELLPLLLCLRAGRTFPFEEGAPSMHQGEESGSRH